MLHYGIGVCVLIYTLCIYKQKYYTIKSACTNSAVNLYLQEAVAIDRNSSLCVCVCSHDHSHDVRLCTVQSCIVCVYISLHIYTNVLCVHSFAYIYTYIHIVCSHVRTCGHMYILYFHVYIHLYNIMCLCIDVSVYI